MNYRIVPSSTMMTETLLALLLPLACAKLYSQSDTEVKCFSCSNKVMNRYFNGTAASVGFQKLIKTDGWYTGENCQLNGNLSELGEGGTPISVRTCSGRCVSIRAHYNEDDIGIVRGCWEEIFNSPQDTKYNPFFSSFGCGLTLEDNTTDSILMSTRVDTCYCHKDNCNNRCLVDGIYDDGIQGEEEGTGVQCKLPELHRTCDGWRQAKYNKNGVYQLTYENGDRTKAYCDMELDGGGWTVLHQRFNGSQSFDQDWKAYVDGFGTLGEGNEFWWGLENMFGASPANPSHEMNSPIDMRFDMTTCNGTSHHQTYYQVLFHGKTMKYKLYANANNGTANDSLLALPSSNNQAFSTRDADNDGNDQIDCARAFGNSGWWYRGCANVNFNGHYTSCDTPGTMNSQPTLHWGLIPTPNNVSKVFYSLKTASIRIRPHVFPDDEVLAAETTKETKKSRDGNGETLDKSDKTSSVVEEKNGERKGVLEQLKEKVIGWFRGW